MADIKKIGELLNPKRLANAGEMVAKVAMAKAGEHGPELLAFAAIGGLIATVKLAVDATPKAVELRENRQVKTDEDGNVAETRVEAIVEDVKAVAPVYLPAAVAGVVTAGCIIGGNRIQAREIKGLKADLSSLAAAYSLSEKAMDAYKKEVIDKLGEDVHDEIKKKVVEQTGSDPDDCPFDGGYILNQRENGDQLFYDMETGFVFWSTEEKIRAAEGKVAKDTFGGPQTVCDLYAAMGVRYDSWRTGELRGWTVEGTQIDITFGEGWKDATCEPDGDIPKRILCYNTQALGY